MSVRTAVRIGRRSIRVTPAIGDVPGKIPGSAGSRIPAGPPPPEPLRKCLSAKHPYLFRTNAAAKAAVRHREMPAAHRHPTPDGVFLRQRKMKPEPRMRKRFRTPSDALLTKKSPSLQCAEKGIFLKKAIKTYCACRMLSSSSFEPTTRLSYSRRPVPPGIR